MTEISLMNENDMNRVLTRIAHEIIEGNEGLERLALIGIRRRGVPLAKRIARYIERFEGKSIPVGELDITLYRDDLESSDGQPRVNETDIPFSIDGMHLVMVDDVLYTGRTARSAMDALIDMGRPGCIRLAALVDRGHRELPIRGDYVGKNIPTARSERISVKVKELDGEDAVILQK